MVTAFTGLEENSKVSGEEGRRCTIWRLAHKGTLPMVRGCAVMIEKGMCAWVMGVTLSRARSIKPAIWSRMSLRMWHAWEISCVWSSSRTIAAGPLVC